MSSNGVQEKMLEIKRMGFKKKSLSVAQVTIGIIDTKSKFNRYGFSAEITLFDKKPPAGGSMIQRFRSVNKNMEEALLEARNSVRVNHPAPSPFGFKEDLIEEIKNLKLGNGDSWVIAIDVWEALGSVMCVEPNSYTATISVRNQHGDIGKFHANGASEEEALFRVKENICAEYADLDNDWYILGGWCDHEDRWYYVSNFFGIISWTTRRADAFKISKEIKSTMLAKKMKREAKDWRIRNIGMLDWMPVSCGCSFCRMSKKNEE